MLADCEREPSQYQFSFPTISYEGLLVGAPVPSTRLRSAHGATMARNREGFPHACARAEMSRRHPTP